MDRASPPVSPTVVAQILITQNMRVTCGTLLSRSPLRCSSDDEVTGIALSCRPRSARLPSEAECEWVRVTSDSPGRRTCVEADISTVYHGRTRPQLASNVPAEW